MPLRIVDPRRLLDGYLLIRHLCTLGWVVLPILVGGVAGSIFLRTAASAAVDAEVLQPCVLVRLLGACHSYLLRFHALRRTVIAVLGSGPTLAAILFVPSGFSAPPL